MVSFAPEAVASPVGTYTAIKPSTYGLMGITAGPDGNMWFVNYWQGRIGRISPSGIVANFSQGGIQPTAITSGPDGNLWFTGNTTGRITPSGVITKFATTTSGHTPHGITTGPDGNLWFTNGTSIGRMTTSGVVTHFTDPGISQAWGIAAGPDGNLWFTNYASSSIGRITPAGVVTKFGGVGVGVSSPKGIAAGPDGNLWFTNVGGLGGWIARITTAGVVEAFSAPFNPKPEGIAAGPDGNLWFTDRYTIGRITTAGVYTMLNGPASDGRGIAAGPDGNLWFTHDSSPVIGRVTPAGVFTGFTDIGLNNPTGVATGPDGNLWLTNNGNNSIGRVSPGGLVANFTGPGVDRPQGIAAGPDGNLWFTNNGNNSIGRITPAGAVSNFVGTNINAPQGITSGPDGNLWFTNSGGGSIGRITPAGVVSNFSTIARPSTIAAGPDGNLWFTSYARKYPYAGSIGRITPSGAASTITAVGINDPAPGNPGGIVAGPDGGMWFTNDENDTLGRVTAVGEPAAPVGPVANPGDKSVTVSWSAPPLQGFPPITGYTVTALPGGATCAWTSGPLSCTVAGLTNGAWYSFSVTASNAQGTSVPSSYTPVVAPRPPPFVALAPARLLETRSGPGLATVDGQFQGAGPRPAWSTLALTVTGRAGIPTDASAVSLNVTVTGPAGTGFVTVFPCGTPQPNASNLNYVAGQVIPNAVITKIGTNGQICLFTNTTTDLLVDINGYFPAGSNFGPLTPARLLETRSGPGLTTVDGQFQGTGPRPAWSTLALTVTGRAGIPTDATAVSLNVTVTGPAGTGFVTVFPCGTPQPNASNLNYVAGQVIPNAVITKIGTNGQICLFTNTTTDLLVDINGYFPAGSNFGPLTPARLLETRSGPGLTTVDGQFQGTGPRPAWSTLALTVTGRAGIPTDASAVSLNVTVTGPAGTGFVTVFPCGTPQPNASNLNYVAGQVIPNAVITKIGTNGQVCLFTNTATDLLVDINGYFPAV